MVAAGIIPNTRRNVSDLGWMVVAFVAVGAGIGGYMLSIVARRRRLRRRLDRSAHEHNAARP